MYIMYYRMTSVNIGELSHLHLFDALVVYYLFPVTTSSEKGFIPFTDDPIVCFA